MCIFFYTSVIVFNIHRKFQRTLIREYSSLWPVLIVSFNAALARNQPLLAIKLLWKCYVLRLYLDAFRAFRRMIEIEKFLYDARATNKTPTWQSSFFHKGLYSIGITFKTCKYLYVRFANLRCPKREINFFLENLKNITAYEIKRTLSCIYFLDNNTNQFSNEILVKDW